MKTCKTAEDVRAMSSAIKEKEIIGWVVELDKAPWHKTHFANQSGKQIFAIELKELKDTETLAELRKFVEERDKLISPDGGLLARVLKDEIQLQDFPDNVLCVSLLSKVLEVPFGEFDPTTLFKIFDKLRTDLIMGQLAHSWNIEHKAMLAICEMQNSGIQLDTKAHMVLCAKTQVDIFNAAEELKSILKPYVKTSEFGETEINLDSSKELLDALKQMKCVIQMSNGNLRPIQSTNKDEVALIKDHSDLKEALTNYRGLSHIQNNFGQAFKKFAPVGDRIYTTFNQIGAPTGRTSTEKPNISGVPEEVRHIFRGRNGEKIITADYNQCELRILAHMSDDPGLIDAFNKGLDIHSYTAQQMFEHRHGKHNNEMRHAAKAVNFGIVFGISIEGLAINLRCSYSEAADLYFKHKAKFKKAHEYMAWVGQESLRNKCARSMSGRIRSFEGPPNQDEGYVKRAGANMAIQGTAADIMKSALHRIRTSRKSHNTNFTMWNTTYDEVSARVLPDDVPMATLAIGTAMKWAMNGFITKVPAVVSLKVEDHWTK